MEVLKSGKTLVISMPEILKVVLFYAFKESFINLLTSIFNVLFTASTFRAFDIKRTRSSP